VKLLLFEHYLICKEVQPFIPSSRWPSKTTSSYKTIFVITLLSIKLHHY